MSRSSCSCVNTKVPVSYSFQSLSVPTPSYDPGLASLTLRIYTTKCGPRESGSDGCNDTKSPEHAKKESLSTGYGEMRLVHCNKDICKVVQQVVHKHSSDIGVGNPEIKDNVDTAANDANDEEEEYNHCFTSLMTGSNIMNDDTRTQFILDLFSGLTSISWDIINSSSLTAPPTDPTRSDMYEAFTWILKKQHVPIPGIDTIAIRISESQDEGMIYTIYAPDSGNNMEVNNILKASIESATPKPKQLTKTPSSDGELSSDACEIKISVAPLDGCAGVARTNESGYISEEDKKSEDEAETNIGAQNNQQEDEINAQNLDEQSKGKELDKDAEVDIETAEEAFEIDTSTDVNTETKDNVNEELNKDNKEPSENTKETDKVTAEDKLTENEDESQNSPGRGVVLRNKSLLMEKLFGGGQQMIRRSPTPTFRESQDDPLCPNEFKVRSEDYTTTSKVLLDLSFRMFARQWKLVAGPRHDSFNETILLFEHDSRILPGIGQQVIAGVCVQQQGEGVRVHLRNIKDQVVQHVAASLNMKEDTQEAGVFIPEDMDQFLSGIVFCLSEKSYSLYRSVQLKQAVLIMFRVTNLDAGEGLCLHLLRGNIIRLLTATHQDVQIVRDVIQSRWPYPLQDDHQINVLEPSEAAQVADTDAKDEEDTAAKQTEDDFTNKEDTEKSLVKMDWEWRVKRYPWRVSYGVKMLDRAVSQLHRVLTLPSPKHQDLESAKSIVIFCIKELSQQGYRFVGSFNIHQQSYLQFIK